MRNTEKVRRSAAPNLLVQFPLAELTLQLAVDPSKSRRSIPARADGKSRRLILTALAWQRMTTTASSYPGQAEWRNLDKHCRPALVLYPAQRRQEVVAHNGQPGRNIGQHCHSQAGPIGDMFFLYQIFPKTDFHARKLDRK
jgi:hypothetical protein